MNDLKSHIKTNLVYGLLAAIPIAIVGLLVLELIKILGAVTTKLGLESNLGASVVVVVALVLLLLVIYVLGMLIRTSVGSWSYEKLEQKLLVQIPGYSIVSGVLKGFVDSNKEYQPALICLYQPGTAVMGFVMDENPDDTITVFVPSTPAMTVGSVHIVTRERVTLIDATHMDLVNCITEWGVGTSKVIGSKKQDEREA